MKYSSLKDFEKSEGRIAFGKKMREELKATREWSLPIGMFYI